MPLVAVLLNAAAIAVLAGVLHLLLERKPRLPDPMSPDQALDRLRRVVDETRAQPRG